MRYHDGELEDEPAREVERQLATDPEACRVLEALSGLGDAVRAAEHRPGIGPDLADQVMQRISADRARSGSRLWRRTVPVATAALAAAAAVGLWLSTGKDAERPPDAVSSLVVPSSQQPTLPEPVAAVLALDNGPAVAIENVEFGERTGTIFMVPGNEQETAVVWLSDDPGGASGMEHL
jgi:hypothetical protein